MRLNQVVQNVPPSGIRRFFDLVSQMEDVISLGVGEPDFATPWRIREAAIYSLEKGYTTYTSNWGLLELRQAVALYLDRHYRVELLKIAALGERHDLVVRSDEIYARLSYGEPHPCFASLPGAEGRTILLGRFSKSHAMTGWRVGFAAGPADAVGAMTKIHQYTMLCAPITAQMAALEALKNGDPDVEEMVTQYDERRRLVVAGFRSLGLDCFEPEGAFYAFP